MKKISHKKLHNYLIVYIGCMIQAFAVTSILRPNNLIVGGFTGISLVLGNIFNINYTFFYYTLCLSILILAWRILGKQEALKILLLSTTYPIVLIIFNSLNLEFISLNDTDILIVCIYYGIISGIGMGLVLKQGFSLGSSDTLAKIINTKLFPFMSISQTLLAIDIFILLVSGFIFGKNAVLYAIIMQIIYIKTVDTIIFGFGSSLVKIVVLSEETNLIADYILNSINRGVSIDYVTGAYTKQRKQKVICICSARESIMIKNAVAKIDNSAFINVVPVISAWGKGSGFDILETE